MKYMHQPNAKPIEVDKILVYIFKNSKTDVKFPNTISRKVRYINRDRNRQCVFKIIYSSKNVISSRYFSFFVNDEILGSYETQMLLEIKTYYRKKS